MKKDFLTFAKGGFVLLDGGFGTELQRAGLPAGTPPEELNLTAPEKVLALHRAYIESGALHRAYIESGADVISSNTFGANRRKHPAAGEAARLTQTSRGGRGGAAHRGGRKAREGSGGQ